MNSLQYYIDLYRKNRLRDLPESVYDMKDRAMEILTDKSFPSEKDENYLYTPIAPVFDRQLSVFRPSLENFSPDLVTKILRSDIPEIDSYSIFVTNGYHLNNEPIHELPGRIVLGSFINMIKHFGSVYRDFFSNYQLSDDVLVNLNTMLSGDGFFLFVPAGATPAKPIQIINLFDGPDNILIQPRNLIVMEEGSSADIMVCDYTLSDHSFVCNDVTEIALKKNASLNLVRMQKVNGATDLMTHTVVQQAESSQMKTHYLSISGASVRNNLSVMLNGKNADHTAKGLSFTQQTEHVDNHVQITHASPDCRSNQLFKHILSDTSTGAFTGRIIVAEGAQKTSAYQRSGNILLQPEAKMNIRPQLEIYADDVKCSHGATVGQLDAEALFYLRSRGIGEVEAKKLLLRAFAEEVLTDISNESVKAEIIRLADRKTEEGF